MSRMYDTKGRSLRWLMEGLDAENLSDLLQVACLLESVAPGSVAATRTRRICVLVAEAEREASDEALRQVWADTAYQMENGWKDEDAANAALAKAPPALSARSEEVPAVGPVLVVLEEAKALVARLEATRDALAIGLRPPPSPVVDTSPREEEPATRS